MKDKLKFFMHDVKVVNIQVFYSEYNVKFKGGTLHKME